MKLIIQIPCFNEELTLTETIRDLPRQIDGIDAIEILVIDDGSSDNTASLAASLGAHVARHKKNRGLAAAFMTGIRTALSLGADIIVNTDADNQYKGSGIPRLVAPILAKEADMVIGARPIVSIEHFSISKKFLQKLGSSVVRIASGTSVPDAPSGFRAYSKEAALRLNVFNRYTYTLETIIQAGIKNIAVTTVPIEVNPPTRPSRLFKSNFGYVLRSMATIIRIFLLYRSFRFLAAIGGTLCLGGIIAGLRFLWFYLTGTGGGHIQSLILAAILIITGFQTILIGIVTDLIAANRMLLEELTLYKRTELDRRHADNSSRP